MTPSADRGAAPAEPRPLVLVIDDDRQVRDFVRAVLTANGYEVAEAGDGDPGLALARRRPPAVVLCDMFMPEREGLETIVELRKLAPRTRIVAMSGGGAVCRLDPLPYAVRLGAARTLPKPFTDQELLATVAGALADPPAP